METKQNNSRKNADSKERKDVTALCASLILSVIFLLAFLSPLYQKKLAMDGAYIDKQEDLKSKEELLRNIEAFNEENRDLTVNSEKLALLIPNRNNYEDFLIHIQQLSRSFNLELLGFTLSDIKAATVVTPGTTTSTGAVITSETTTTTGPTDSNLKQQGIDIAMRGDYSSFVNFARALENGTPFLQEDSVNISSETVRNTQSEDGSSAANPNPMLNFEMGLRFIHY